MHIASSGCPEAKALDADVDLKAGQGSCRMTACLVPLRKVCIDLLVGWEEEEAQTSKNGYASKAIARSNILFLALLGCRDVFLFVCLWVYLYSVYLSIVPVCPLVLQ